MTTITTGGKTPGPKQEPLLDAALENLLSSIDRNGKLILEIEELLFTVTPGEKPEPLPERPLTVVSEVNRAKDNVICQENKLRFILDKLQEVIGAVKLLEE